MAKNIFFFNMNPILKLKPNDTDNNKIDIIFKIKESDQYYVERINILGNNITHENVIRNSLEISNLLSPDTFEKISRDKSIATCLKISS